MPLKVAFPNADIPVVEMSVDQGSGVRIASRGRPGADPLARSGRSDRCLRYELSQHARLSRSALSKPSEDFDSWLTESIALSGDARAARLKRWEEAPAARLSHADIMPPRRGGSSRCIKFGSTERGVRTARPDGRADRKRSVEIVASRLYPKRWPEAGRPGGRPCDTIDRRRDLCVVGAGRTCRRVGLPLSQEGSSARPQRRAGPSPARH